MLIILINCVTLEGASQGILALVVPPDLNSLFTPKVSVTVSLHCYSVRKFVGVFLFLFISPTISAVVNVFENVIGKLQECLTPAFGHHAQRSRCSCENLTTFNLRSRSDIILVFAIVMSLLSGFSTCETAVRDARFLI